MSRLEQKRTELILNASAMLSDGIIPGRRTGKGHGLKQRKNGPPIQAVRMAYLRHLTSMRRSMLHILLLAFFMVKGILEKRLISAPAAVRIRIVIRPVQEGYLVPFSDIRVFRTIGRRELRKLKTVILNTQKYP